MSKLKRYERTNLYNFYTLRVYKNDHQVRDENDEARAVLNAVKEDIRLWPKDPKTKEVNIPFTIDRGYNATSMDLMYMGMKTIERFSCIRWRNRKREYDYVRIINMTNCAAMVGHTPGRNDVYLNEPGTSLYQ